MPGEITLVESPPQNNTNDLCLPRNPTSSRRTPLPCPQVVHDNAPMLSLRLPHVSSQYIRCFLRIRSHIRMQAQYMVMEFVHCLAQAVLDSQSVSLLVGKEQCLCFETQFRWDLTQSATHCKFLMIHLAQPSGRHRGLLLVTGKRPVEMCPPGKLKVSEKWNVSSFAPCIPEGAKAASKGW